MQRPENDPDAFFRFSWGKHFFLLCLRQNRAQRVLMVRTILRDYGKSTYCFPS